MNFGHDPNTVYPQKRRTDGRMNEPLVNCSLKSTNQLNSLHILSFQASKTVIWTLCSLWPKYTVSPVSELTSAAAGPEQSTNGLELSVYHVMSLKRGKVIWVNIGDSHSQTASLFYSGTPSPRMTDPAPLWRCSNYQSVGQSTWFLFSLLLARSLWFIENWRTC